MTTHRPSGFTLVELMIALTVGGIAISSIYALGAASTRHFREQNRVSTTQSSLRAAMNQVKRDFQRAGYLATPNVAVEAERCAQVDAPLNDSDPTPGRGRLAAISAYRKNVADATVLDPDRLNLPWATVDDVTLMGNYSTSGEYMGVVLAPGGRSFTIPITTHSFRRDFTQWYPTGGTPAGSCNQIALTNAFPSGRLVRLHALNDRNAYAQVEAATCTAAGATISLQQDIRAPCNVTSGWASPVNTIRYHVANAAGVETTRIGDNRVAQLRRTEVSPANKATPLDITIGGTTRRADDRAVLDYVVRFDVDFLTRVPTTGANNSLDWVEATVNTVQQTPEFVRGVIIELAVRTAEHEPDMDVTGSSVTYPPFRVFNTRGAARTRVLRAELLLPNVSYQRY